MKIVQTRVKSKVHTHLPYFPDQIQPQTVNNIMSHYIQTRCGLVDVYHETTENAV